jgi:hypothetical protein
MAGREERSPGAFLRGLLTRTLSLIAAVASLNLLVNPFGSYGTHLFEPIVVSSRRPKLALYERRRPSPAIVVLGSSRSFTMEPAYIEARTSRPAFNAAVHAGGPRDYVDFARCFAAERAFPSTMIVGLGVEQLLTQPLVIERRDPLANCLAPEEASIPAFVRTYRGLFTLEEAWASLRLLFVEIEGRPAPPYRFAADGSMRVSETRPLDQAVDDALAGNWRPSLFDVPGLHPKSVDRVRQLLELCRDHETKVIVYLPPYQPRATARYLKESRFPFLRAQLLEELTSWATRYPVKFHDFTEVSSFGGRDDMFYDASHPTAEACRLMLDVMLGDLT